MDPIEGYLIFRYLEHIYKTAQDLYSALEKDLEEEDKKDLNDIVWELSRLVCRLEDKYGHKP